MDGLTHTKQLLNLLCIVYLFCGCSLAVPVLSQVDLFKKLIQFLECSWNHEYFGSLAK